MRAVILAVGDELVAGETIDTNSAYLARELAAVGIETVAHWTVADDQARLVAALRAAAEQADVVLVSGGLGPTPDDVTRQAVAEATGTDLKLDEAQLRRIESRLQSRCNGTGDLEFFRRRGREMVAANRIQAMIPAGAEALGNERGTAAGIAGRVGRARLFVVPGVPHEMRWMFQHRVRPRLPAGTGVILYRVLHTFGMGESDVAARISDLIWRSGDVTVGTTVSAGLVSVRVTSRAATAEQAQRQAQQTTQALRARLGDLVVGEGEATPAGAVGEALAAAGQTVSVAESCTGGLVGEMITSVPGASGYFRGAVVAYDNAVKESLLGVPGDLLNEHGAVSGPVAAAMAEGCRRRFGTDWAVAITGIAGPTGGTESKPVGLVYVALASPAGTSVQRHVFPGDRPTIRRRAALAALNGLRLAVRAHSEPASEAPAPGQDGTN